MRINPIIPKQNFGRAFTTEEKKAYVELINDAKDALQIQDTTAIVFDFNTGMNDCQVFFLRFLVKLFDKF